MPKKITITMTLGQAQCLLDLLADVIEDPHFEEFPRKDVARDIQLLMIDAGLPSFVSGT